MLRVPLSKHRTRNPSVTVFERNGEGRLQEVMCDVHLGGQDVIVLVNSGLPPFSGELHLS